MPRSARISVSSNSSKKASSASEKPEKRFVVIFFSLSKKPMVSSQIGNQRRRGLSQSNLFPQYLQYSPGKSGRCAPHSGQRITNNWIARPAASSSPPDHARLRYKYGPAEELQNKSRD